MQNVDTQMVVVFIIVCTFLVLLLITFIAIIIYRYQQKQHMYLKDVDQLKAIHKTNLLQTQIEIQEQTFQNISREIHDNIGQKLTLAKLHLNTLENSKSGQNDEKIQNAVNMIGEAINDLSDLSRSMSADLVLQNGLLKALEFETSQLSKLGLFKINLNVSELTFFLEPHSELTIFRIAQEAINNILKHSSASEIDITLIYSSSLLTMEIKDNGIGFQINRNLKGNGLPNMNKRAELLGGLCVVSNNENQGTCITIKIPIYAYKEAV